MLPLTDTRPSTQSKASQRPALILSHSFGFSRKEWIQIAEIFSDEYRTIAIDMPGFGDAKEIPGYSMAEMAAMFAETISGLALDRYVLVGHSMSGKLMSILASRAGKEFGLKRPPEKLVLLTPTPLSQEVGGEDMRQKLLQAPKHRWGAEEFVATHSGLPLKPEVHERAIQDYLGANKAAWDAWLNEGIREDWVDRAAPIELPTLVIAAEQDPVWGPAMQQELTMPHLSKAKLVTVNSGHTVPMEAADKLAELLRAFIGD